MQFSIIAPPGLASSFPPYWNFSKRASFSNNFSSRPQRRWVSTHPKKAPEHCVQVKRSLISILWKSSARTRKFKPGSTSSILHVFYYRNYWKNFPLSRNSSETERKRPDQEGLLPKNCSERSGGNYIAWMNCVHYNIMHCELWFEILCRRVATIQVNAPAVLGGVLTFGEHEFTWITQL